MRVLYTGSIVMTNAVGSIILLPGNAAEGDNAKGREELWGKVWMIEDWIRHTSSVLGRIRATMPTSSVRQQYVSSSLYPKASSMPLAACFPMLGIQCE